MPHSSWLLTFPAVLLFASCASDPGAGSVASWEKETRARMRSFSSAPSLEGVTIPILRSPLLDSSWGKPAISRDSSGGYMLTYSHPAKNFTRLMITGMTSPLPTLVTPPMLGGEEMVNDQLTGFQRPQNWRTVNISGKTVRWYQESTGGGADGAYYSTEGFSLTPDVPGSPTGYYRLVAEGGDDPAQPAGWFSSAVITR